MYCPNCGNQSTADLRFCRSCGTDLGVVSEALTGKLATTNAQSAPETRRQRRRHRHDEDDTPRIDSAVIKFFGGVAFICASFGALFFAPAGRIWWSGC